MATPATKGGAQRRGHGAKAALASESHWLLSTAGKWTEEDEKEWKRQQHRENMVYFRLKKKAQQRELRDEHRRLELRLQQHLAIQRRNAARASRGVSPLPSDSSELARKRAAARDLVMEREALKSENAALVQQLSLHKSLQDLALDASGSLQPQATPQSDASSQGTGGSSSDSSLSSSSSASSSSLLSDDGWRVQFDGGEPSFHFHPFSKHQCSAIREQYDAKFAVLPRGLTTVGEMLGWKVERAPLVRHPATNAIVARVRYTRRIRCTSGSAVATMDRLDADSWPVLVTPKLWGRIHNDTVTSQVLQVLDEDTHVLVRNIPQRTLGVHVRYLNLVHRRRSRRADGRRVVAYAMVIADSPANSRSREAEPPRRDVLWVPEGGAYMTLAQVDETTLEVIYDHCAGCMSEQHAQHCLVDWGHIALRWEQLVTPSRLLAA